VKVLKVACVILNYNDYKTTIQLIDSISAFQSIDFIIIVDNNSTDNSVDMLSEYIGEKIYLVKTNKNGGYGYGNNIGVLYAKNKLGCTHVIISNPDVIFSDKCVQKMKEVMRNYACACAAPVPFSIAFKEQIFKAWKLPTALQELLLSSTVFSILFSNLIFYGEKDFRQDISVVDVVAGSLLILNIDDFIEAGMYDDELFLYMEETVLGLRLKNKGYKTLLINSENYIHLHSVSINKSFPNAIQKKQMSLVSKKKLLIKYHRMNNAKLFIASIFLMITLVEEIFIQVIKKLFNLKSII
jgi:GT2 family glycosyltransferase